MSTNQTDIFKFVCQRSVQRASEAALARTVVPFLLPGDALEGENRFNYTLTREEVQKWATQFVATPDKLFVDDLSILETPILTLDGWLLARGNSPARDDVHSFIVELTQMEPTILVEEFTYRTDRNRVALSLAALTLAPFNRFRLRGLLMRAMSIFGLIEQLAWHPDLFGSETDIHDYLINATILLPSFFPAPSGALARPPAMADLKVVRQELLRYESGEIAHIENVLKGESKERSHRRTNTREEIVTREVEREELNEHELQSTDRFEMQQETSQVISEDSHFEAGLNVKASYGPTVEVNLNAGYESNYAKEESKRAASSFAHAATERSLQRLREKVRELRTIRTVSEVEEINKHAIKNDAVGAGHVVGIYRWVDKVYKAQVFNYGKRLLLEFVVPEPAAFVKHVFAQQAQPAVTAEKPEPPLVEDRGKRRPLKPDDIKPENYREWVAKYFVREAEPPPPDNLWVNTAWEDAATEKGITFETLKRKIFKVNREVEIPGGYKVTQVFGTIHVTDFYQNVFLTIGGLDIRLSQYKKGNTEPFSTGISFNEMITQLVDPVIRALPIALTIEQCWGYTIVVMVKCSLLPSGLQGWQQKIYQQIMSAYFELKSLYEEQVAAAQTRQGVAIEGRNPDENRLIERNEIKRQVIAVLEQQHFNQPPIERDAIQLSQPEHYPETNFEVAQAERDFIQWFEQAFEWQQMSYVFYPYYWGKKASWVEELLRSDPDPIFVAFLKSGAARVSIPVRPGFEKVMALYLSTGVIWNAGQVPQVNDPLYVSIVQEIQEQQEAVPGGTAEGDPWEVRLPTTLVILQEDAGLNKIP